MVSIKTYGEMISCVRLWDPLAKFEGKLKFCRTYSLQEHSDAKVRVLKRSRERKKFSLTLKGLKFSSLFNSPHSEGTRLLLIISMLR